MIQIDYGQTNRCIDLLFVMDRVGYIVHKFYYFIRHVCSDALSQVILYFVIVQNCTEVLCVVCAVFVIVCHKLQGVFVLLLLFELMVKSYADVEVF